MCICNIKILQIKGKKLKYKNDGKIDKFQKNWKKGLILHKQEKGVRTLILETN